MVSAIKFKNQLQQVIQYLSQRNNQYPLYEELINALTKIEQEISENQLKILLVAQEAKLIDEIKNITLDCIAQDSVIQTAVVTDAMHQIEQHYDLILLILDAQQLSQDEIKLLKKSSKSKTHVGILVKENDLEINSFLKEASDIDIFRFSEQEQQEVPIFINSLFNKILEQKPTKSKQKILTSINQNIEQAKKIFWQRIQEDKTLHLGQKNPEQTQQAINQIPHRCNRIIQNYLRIFKQNNNQNKLNLVNPFCCDSLMYQIQNAIQEAEVISQQGEQKVYLSLVLEKNNYNQVIHHYLVESSQQLCSAWLREEWQNITTQYNNGGLEKLHQQLKLEIQPLADLSIDISLVQPQVKYQFQLENYICLSALENNSKVPFDYHYTQSTWFRLLVAVSIGLIIYLLIEHLFGFILLFVQIVNLITGQDAKTIRMRQQTKEMKRIVDGKYQLLIRLLADKLVQDIAIALDDINQDYQEQIEQITQQATNQLNQIKQKIAQNKDYIKELKQTQLKLQTILQEKL